MHVSTNQMKYERNKSKIKKQLAYYILNTNEPNRDKGVSLLASQLQ